MMFMNIRRLAGQKKTKELQKGRGHLAVSHGKHFCKLLREEAKAHGNG
jgi:hypothetical protein